MTTPPAGTAPAQPQADRLGDHNRMYALPGNEAFFRQLVSGMRNGVLAVARDGTITLINDEAYRVFGMEARDGDLGRPVSDVLRHVPGVVRVLADAAGATLLPNRAELRLKPAGTVIGYTLAHARSDDGEITGTSMLFKDLTRVEQLEERERLRNRLAAVGEMAAAIAHEVKNPLAGIEVIAGLLRRKLPAVPDAQALLTDIINEVKMANAIVQEVLDFVRPMQLQMERTSVAHAIRGATELAGTSATRGASLLTIDVADDLPLIGADSHQLVQLFTNLLANAYEALAGSGQVSIRARVVYRPSPHVPVATADGPGAAVMVEVADDGPGMVPEVAERVFDPFFTTKPKGSGLGLAIVRKIVDAHEGRLDLRTSPGQGTLIAVTLPVVPLHDKD
jgi:PAS domain S-box-containing protein